MKKSLLTLSVVVASLLGMNAFAAGEGGPSQDQSVPAAKATKTEKSTAKVKRKAEGAEAAKSGLDAGDQPTSSGVRKAATKEEKALAKAKRKSEGAAASKAPKEKSGPAS